MEVAYRNVTAKVNSIFRSSISIIIFFLLWELAPRLGWVKETFISPPTVVVETIWELFRNGGMIEHIGVSLERAIFGFILATVVAVPLGFLLGGWFKTFQRVVTPVLRLFSELNPFSLFPVFILLFGIEDLSKVVMIYWVCQWPILFNTITGVKSVDPLLIKAAKAMGASHKTIFLKVILPSAAPGIFTGLKLASGSAFFMLIAAEMIGASSGLGWLVWNAQINYQISKLFAATVVIALLGLLINELFARIERKVIVWK